MGVSRKARAPEAPASGDLVADRYEVLSSLGRGGMGVAMRVRDRATGRELALKRLSATHEETALVELFEREFHTLTGLAHPRIVRAFDYGWDGAYPYYTMELLDGGDLRKLAPLPWQEVCAIAYDLCSALSLLHSRRLVHRDLTPRNVRRTGDGAAKLIDFGLLGPFGPCSMVAGTPAYVAPEVVHKVSLDGRSDLFSLGATMYYALTGKQAFRAARFEQLRDVWRSTPRSPHELVPGVPEALDRLVLSLIRLDANSRPKSAAEVMEHLRPLLPEPPDEALDAVRAYLTAPAQVGRDELVVRLRKQVFRARLGRGGGFLISGAAGTGRSRMLDMFVVEAKLMGAVAVRAGARSAAIGPLGVARAIVEQIHDGARAASVAAARSDPEAWRVLFGSGETADADPGPALLDIARPELDRGVVQGALGHWLLRVCRAQLVALAVDDLDMIDGPSAALLATLSRDASNVQLAYCFSLPSEATNDTLQAARALLERHARSVELMPLSQPEMRQLLAGVFGEVPNLEGLSRQLYDLSGGKPRECMLLAQDLVDRGVIRHAGGSFRLPAAIDPSALPAGLEGALSALVAALSPAAMTVGQLLSLAALGRLGRAQLAAMAGLSTALVDQAISELQKAQAVAGDPQGYWLSQPAFAALLTKDLDTYRRRQLHDCLADAYRSQGEAVLSIACHALQGEHREAAMEVLLDHFGGAQARSHLMAGYAALGVDVTAEVLLRGLTTASELGRSKNALMALWPRLASAAAMGADERYYDLVAEPWLRELKALTGYDDWHALADMEDAGARLTHALQRAAQRHAAMPDEAVPHCERRLAPADAIKELIAYVVCSIAVGTRAYRLRLIESLPELLVPFSSLSPLVNAMRLNAESTCVWAQGRIQEVYHLQFALLAAIDAVEGDELPFMAQVRAAVCQSIAWNAAGLGIDADPDQWLVSHDPAQRIGGEYIKKVVALHRGDWDAAESHRRRAELIALQHDTSNMFTVLREELEAHVLARDLTGLRAVRERLHAWATRAPAWASVAMVADACYDYLCGEASAALEKIAAVRKLRAEDGYDLRCVPLLEAVAVEILLASDQVDEALALGLRVIDGCRARGHRHMARIVAGPVAVAEARAGRYREARARLEAVIAEQEALNVRGLLLGRSAEFLARCALATGDRQGFLEAAATAATQYGAGRSAVLGALHERLIEDARRAGLIDASPAAGAGPISAGHARSVVHSAFESCVTPEERARSALRLLCEGACVTEGHLYLSTRSGVRLSASLPETQPTSADMLAFASARIEMELDCDVGTVSAASVTAGMVSELTAAPSEVALSVGSTGGPEVHDPSGRPFKSLVLFAEQGDQTLVAGVALLPITSASASLGTRAAAVARKLVEAGDCHPLVAA